jgi:hypothetical protein
MGLCAANRIAGSYVIKDGQDRRMTREWRSFLLAVSFDLANARNTDGVSGNF